MNSIKQTTVLALLFFLPFALFAQKKNVVKPKNIVNIKTLIYCLDNLTIDQMDDYFLSRGYSFNGSKKYGDTVTMIYKYQNSFARIGIDFLNNVKTNVFYYTTLDVAAQYILNTAKQAGFKLSRNEFEENHVSTSYEKKPYFLMYFKTFYPEDNTSSYKLMLGKFD